MLSITFNIHACLGQWEWSLPNTNVPYLITNVLNLVICSHLPPIFYHLGHIPHRHHQSGANKLQLPKVQWSHTCADMYSEPFIHLQGGDYSSPALLHPLANIGLHLFYMILLCYLYNCNYCSQIKLIVVIIIEVFNYFIFVCKPY